MSHTANIFFHRRVVHTATKFSCVDLVTLKKSYCAEIQVGVQQGHSLNDWHQAQKLHAYSELTQRFEFKKNIFGSLPVTCMLMTKADTYMLKKIIYLIDSFPFRKAVIK